MDIWDASSPYAVGFVYVKLPAQQIIVLVYLLFHLLPLLTASYLRQQIILLHCTENGLGIMANALLLQHQSHPPVVIGTKAAFPLLCNESRESSILFWLAQTMDESTVTASRSPK